MGINISNFFIDVGEVIFCDNPVTFSVNVTDDSYYITQSGTYFTYNGNKIIPYYTTIASGYRLEFDTIPSGNVVLELFVSNSNMDTAYNLYEFSYGYNVRWDEVVYWGPNRTVPVSIVASNKEIAPNTEYFATFFKTHNYYYSDLVSYASVDGSGMTDLGVYIKPQSKYFEYGKTYRITISGVKDFSGNILEPFTYEFTIEDKS